jgi:hypothetical protein
MSEGRAITARILEYARREIAALPDEDWERIKLDMEITNEEGVPVIEASYNVTGGHEVEAMVVGPVGAELPEEGEEGKEE